MDQRFANDMNDEAARWLDCIRSAGGHGVYASCEFMSDEGNLFSAARAGTSNLQKVMSYFRANSRYIRLFRGHE